MDLKAYELAAGRGSLVLRQGLIVGTAPACGRLEQRQCAVLRRLRPPQLFHLFELGRILRRQVATLAEILVDVVELPLVALEAGSRLMDSYRLPAFIPNSAAAPKLEVLRIARVRTPGIIEGGAD